MTLRGCLTALAVASALLVTAGCAAEEVPQGATAGGGSGSESADVAADADSDADSGTADADADASDDSDGELTMRECLPGNWYVDNESFGKLIAGTGQGVVDDVTGVVMLSMHADGTSETLYEDWTHSIAVDSPAGSGTMTITKNGTDYGSYEVHGDGTMSMIDTQISSETTSVMKMEGNTVTSVVTPEPSVFSQASFTCAGDELTVTADGGTTILHREH